MTRSPTPARCCGRSSLGLLVTAAVLLVAAQQCSAAYYGKLIGKLSQLHHGVSGEVYAVDARTLFIKDFTYDGEGPAAYFYAGHTKIVGNNGFKVRDERGTTNVLKRYRKKDITLTLPEGKTLANIKWFSVWCDEFAVNFGDVKIPRNFDYPRPQKLEGLSGIHGVSSEPVVVVDAQTLLIPSFSYDGTAPDAKFWVGAGPSPSPQGIRVPDENGKEVPLRRYDRKTIVLTLPGDLTVHQLGHFGVWCEAFAVDFGHVQIQQGLNIPPSLKMLGISPQIVPALDYRVPLLAADGIVARLHQLRANVQDDGELIGYTGLQQPSLAQRRVDRGGVAQSQPVQAHARFQQYQGRQKLESYRSKLNCEVLEDGLAFEVRWAVAGDSIVVQLVGKLDNNQYMSFGLSADPKRSVMVGGDVVVAWVDKQTLQGYAVDYFLDAKSQCSGGRGSCPDLKIQDNTNSVRLLNAAMVNGYSIVTYQRPLKASDELDRQIYTNISQAVIWAIGPLNDKGEVSFHSNYLKGDRFIEFGRPPAWNCPVPELQEAQPQQQHQNRVQHQPQQSQKLQEDSYAQVAPTTRRPHRPQATPAPAPRNGAWEIPPIECYEPEDGVLYAQMGPTGGKHGYPAITGHVGWGISWYINGLLIPEIHVVRGKEYSFVVEGGNDEDKPARYHPFYITDDPVGGYQHKTPEERANVTIFAGVRRQRGVVRPTGVGRLCNWVPDQSQPEADEFTSFGAYQRTLTLECDPGEPGIVTWTPDKNTPDTVYYQCFTHRYLGWKIHVHDSCDTQRGSASEQQEVRVSPNDQKDSYQPVDLDTGASVRASPNQHQVVRRPAAVLVNQVMGMPMRVSYSVPVTAPQNVVYTRTQTQNVRMQSPAPPQMMFMQRKPPQAPLTSYFQAGRRPVSVAPVYQPQISASSIMPVSRAPVFYERKKAYKGPMLSRMQTIGKHGYHGNPYPHYYHHQPTKLVKVESKQQQRSKIEAKTVQNDAMSTEHKTSLLRPMMMKPAKNTGFDPGSIVIEKGFKPILKRTPEVSGKNLDRSSEVMMQDEEIRETVSERYNDSFEPVFIPSPPDRNGVKKQSKKKAQLVRTKLKLENSDDMEMASADRERLDYAYLYLPTMASAALLTKRSPKSGTPSMVSPTASLEHLQNTTSDSNDSQVRPRHSERTKRAALKSESWDATYQQNRDPDNHQDSAKHDHNHDSPNHDDHSTENPHQQASTGEIILANLEYVALTVILYYAL
ncbi:hypothetical protein TSAR_013407 [Trichomalopsis sarcophagae]|uniref:DOMON domain-containing protein n=1 Tax=Trichomalopsis sarcophagae TaxID=543379 RepID=A0A232FGD9_9HYME|nr:hypothetical protein TSAR_013407 [Trichomalopsis sarcophagae]